VLASALSFGGSVAVRRHQEKSQSDVGQRKRDKAFHAFKKGLGQLGDGAAFYVGAAKLLRQYLGDKFGWESAALTAADLERRLPERGVKAETVAGLERFLAECDAAIYGGGGDAGRRANAKDELLDLVKRIQKEGR
jgi:hypothetical protein